MSIFFCKILRGCFNDLRKAHFLAFSLLVFIVFSSKNECFSQKETPKTLAVYNFDKGGHFSKPRQLFARMTARVDTFTWICRFDTSCCYFMRTEKGDFHEDQWDFNKLCGISFNFFNPHINTAMVGWRHHPKKNCFELVPYWHLNRRRYFREKDLIEVAPDETFEVKMITNEAKKEVTTIVKTRKGSFSETQTMGSMGDRVTLINPYFGGTSPAPRAMRLFCERVVKK